MRASRMGAERSCMYLFAYVVGARIAVERCRVCMCVCRHADARRKPPDGRRRGLVRPSRLQPGGI